MGQTWTTLSVPPDTSTYLFNDSEARLVCPSTTTCLLYGAFNAVSGDNGFLVTTDGGATWQPYFTSLVPLESDGFQDLQCPTTTTCFFAFGHISNSTAVIRSDNGGQTWQAVTAPPGSLVMDSTGGLTCRTTATCYFDGESGGSAYVDTTTNAGASWTGPTLLQSQKSPAGLSCTSATTCYAAFQGGLGYSSGVVATTDGWASSSVEPFPSGDDAGYNEGGALYGPLLSCPSNGVCYDTAIRLSSSNPYGYSSLILKGASASPPSDFALIVGAATDIAVGANNSVWVIGTNPVGGGYGIYQRSGSGWAAVTGGAVTIAVAPNGSPWIINSSHQIYAG